MSYVLVNTELLFLRYKSLSKKIEEASGIFQNPNTELTEDEFVVWLTRVDLLHDEFVLLLTDSVREVHLGRHD